jgi:hypothetical protein
MPILEVETAFTLTQTAYLRTDLQQRPRIVTGIVLRERGVLYELSCGVDSSWHAGYEMAEEADTLLKLNN